MNGRVGRVWVAFTLLFLLLSGALGWAKIINPQGGGPDAKVLRSIARPLDRNDIDVVLGKADQFPLGARPRVASIVGFAPNKTDWGTYLRQTWAHAFEGGVVGVLVATKVGGKTTLDQKKRDCETGVVEEIEPCEFVARWLAASEDRRIFVAFTKSDLDAAEGVKKALERQGYVVFLFLKDKAEKPWLDPGLVGAVFAQARHRLVIDTENSRGSEGVAFEKKCCESLLMPERAPTKWVTAIGGGR